MIEAIGVSILSGIGALIVQKLDSFLSQEAQLLLGKSLPEIRNDLEFIKYEVRWATAFLKDMSLQSVNEDVSGEQLNEWLKQTKDLIYEVEDVLDEYKYYNAKRGIIAGKKFAQLMSLKDKKARKCHVASRLKKLMLTARDVKERRERYNFSAEPTAHTHRDNTTNGTSSLKHTDMLDPLLRAHSIQDDKLVGIASQRDVIINWLLEDDMPQRRVISIVGPGGMGKSTLAMKSYESPQITNGQFSCRAHITVSQAFHFKNLMKNLIKQFFDDDFEAKTVNDYVMKIIERLSDKRYLVILDDVCSVDAWGDFSYAFPDNGKGSRIIVTTRNDAVAYTCSSREHVYEIQPLPHEQSKELFCKRVFLVPPFNCPPHLEELMEGILKQCGGMPLAIVTIAGILVSNKEQSKEHWHRVHAHIGHQWEDGAEKMSRILMLSYDDLPYNIKPCFLYLSIFPEDAKLKRSDVVRRWISEGLVSGSNAEQCARSYFDELAHRNLIGPSITQFGEVKYWKIHDLILDLIVEKAVDENFVYIQKKNPQDPKIRRIAVHEEVNTLDDLDLSLARSLSLSFVAEKLKSRQFERMLRHISVREVNILNCVDLSLDRSLNLSFFSSRNIKKEMLNFKMMKLLRMLDLNGCRFIVDRHIDQICEMLLLLKHLGLRSTRISMLPESIKMLQDLEVLDIRATKVKKLPGSFIKLKRLSHFYAGGGNKKVVMKGEEIMKLGNMGSSLRVLKVKTNVSAGVLKALGRLEHLEKLAIVCVKSRKKDSTEIWEKMFLQALRDLSNNSLASLAIRLERSDVHFTSHDSLTPLKFETLKLFGCFTKKGLPGWVESLHYVTKMYLVLFQSTIQSRQNDIRLLGSLQSLVILGLDISNVPEDEDARIDMVIGPQGFQNLNNLLFWFGIHYPKIIFEKGALPNLEYLHLSPKSENNIFGIENLAKLKEIILVPFCIKCLYEKH